MTLEQKLNEMQARYDELNLWLSQPEAMKDQDLWRRSLKEQAELEEVMAGREGWLKAARELAEAKELAESGDGDLKALAQEELPALAEKASSYEERLRALLAPKDPNDGKNVVMEIRAGTGGEEAALFAMAENVHGLRGRKRLEMRACGSRRDGARRLQGSHACH
jgi:peptide chain release factor 1